MDHPAIYLTSVSISCVVCLCLSIATMHRIYKKSSSKFAYTLVAFTLGDAITALIYLIANSINPDNPGLIGFLDQFLT
jgi:hypothetical protein